MSLQEQLDSFRQKFESSAPKEALAIMHRATDDLQKSGLLHRVLREGDEAPDFTLYNAYGKPVHLTERLVQSPVVLGFYRGRW